MYLGEIYKILDEISPFELQESWDNSGILVGDKRRDIKKIYLSLEVEMELLERVEEGSLIITHHPLLFKPLSRICYEEYPSNILEKMIKKDISLISMHTNFDKTHLNLYVLNQILGFKESSFEDFMVTFNPNSSFEELIELVTKKLDLKSPNIVDSGKKEIRKCSLITGSGASFLPKIESDCLLSGDIKYHDAMIAKSLGINMIDIGHFESERFFGEALHSVIGGRLKNLDLLVIIADSFNPFCKR